jgi:hypothetical protein
MEPYCSLPILILIFSQIDRVHVVQSYSFKFQFDVILSSLLHLGLPSGTLPSGFRTKMYFLSISPCVLYDASFVWSSCVYV